MAARYYHYEQSLIMASIIEKGPNGSVTYKSHRQYDLPTVDLLTLLLGEFKPNSR